MRQIDPKAGPRVVLDRMGVLSARLKRSAQTARLALPVDASRWELQRLYDLYLDRHHERMSASGALVFCDAEEDALIALVSTRLLGLVRNQRTDPRYRRMFPKAPSTVTKGVATEAQARLARQVISLIETEPDYAGLRDLLPELKDARQAVVEAQREYREARDRDSAAWNEVQLAEQRARDLYRDTRPRLELLFPGRKKLVDSFFYQPPEKGASGRLSPGLQHRVPDNAPDVHPAHDPAGPPEEHRVGRQVDGGAPLSGGSHVQDFRDGPPLDEQLLVAPLPFGGRRGQGARHPEPEPAARHVDGGVEGPMELGERDKALGRHPPPIVADLRGYRRKRNLPGL